MHQPRGQATLEFLLIFLVTISMVSLMVSALLAQRADVVEKTAQLDRVNKAEAAARAMEIKFSSGIQMSADFSEENMSFRIEQDRLRASQGSKVIQVGGIYPNTQLEPV